MPETARPVRRPPWLRLLWLGIALALSAGVFVGTRPVPIFEKTSVTVAAHHCGEPGTVVLLLDASLLPALERGHRIEVGNAKGERFRLEAASVAPRPLSQEEISQHMGCPIAVTTAGPGRHAVIAARPWQAITTNALLPLGVAEAYVQVGTRPLASFRQLWDHPDDRNAWKGRPDAAGRAGW